MRGVIATGHARVTEAAAALLEAGGNAFDAAVGAGFAAAVAEPMFTSLGGGGFLLARTAEACETLFDFFSDMPGRDGSEEQRAPHFLPVTLHFGASNQVFNIGLGSVAVPGVLAGLLHVHARLGRLALEQVVAPAVQIAREGVVLNEPQAYALALLAPINTLTPRAGALYAPRGRPPAAGERLYNPDLAAFMAALPEDRGESFYRGALARRIDADMRAGGGLLGVQDLSHYRVVEREPLCVAYRDRRVLTNPAPAFGGRLLGASLSLLADALPHSPPWGDAQHLQWLVAVMAEIEAARDAVASGAVSPQQLARGSAERVRRAMGGTTHVSIADGHGNAASMTLSNGEGSGYVVPDTGIMLNNMLGEDDLYPHGFHLGPPGLRVSSMMSPCIVMRDGRVELIVGSGGSKRIRSALIQVIQAVVDHGMEVRSAVDAPRLHWDGECVQVEPGFSEDALARLAQRWPVNRWAERSLYFGGVQAVDSRGAGAGDPRRGGHAARM